MKLIPLHLRSSVFSLVREVPILQFNLYKGTRKERFGNALGPWVWRRAFLKYRRLFRFYPRWRTLSIAISVNARPQASVKAVHEFLAYPRLTPIPSFPLFCIKKNREAVNVLWTVPFLLVVSGWLNSFKQHCNPQNCECFLRTKTPFTRVGIKFERTHFLSLQSAYTEPCKFCYIVCRSRTCTVPRVPHKRKADPCKFLSV